MSVESRRRRDRNNLIIILLIALIVLLSVIILSLWLKPPQKAVKTRPASAAAKAGEEYIAFLDVRQGDGALLKSGDQTAVIDAGTPEGAEQFCLKLEKMGVKDINTLLLTHNHDDHVGGAGKLAGVFSVKNAVLPDLTNTKSPTRIMGTVTEEVTGSGGSCTVGRSGVFYSIGGINIAVLCCYYDLNDENERSIVCMADMNGSRFLFTGDAGRQAENRMLADGIDLDCDVLKVGHHGSKGASTARFLAAATPDYAVISCGAGNKYGHPHDEAISRLKTAGARILRTDESGDITFYFDNNALEYKTEK